MKTLNLMDFLPVGRDGHRSLLPKQRLFLESALGDKYKFLRYSGGVGSGKTIIGCFTLLHMAVLKRGDYLISRQFMPELRSTTYKTFHELCPPELIVEKRIADAETIIRTADGGTSTILFRGLEEPDKLRSLNLNAFYIDEAAQVSETAFMLLQGRLRGRHWRKGFLTQNPGGHDWCWRWFVKQDMISNDAVKKQFLNIRAPSTENVHLPDGYVDTMLATWSKERIEREVMGSDDTFEGMVYPEFDRSLNVVKPFRIPDTWTRRIGVDHGYRNPAAWVYSALDGDGNVYIYHVYYEREKLIEDICRENLKFIGSSKIEQVRIDPSVKATRGATGKSDYDIYLEHLPSGFPLLMAQNDVNAGIERVKSYLRPDRTGKPRLFIFDTCGPLLDEILQYKWEEHTSARQGTLNDKEKPVKNNDHSCFIGSTLVVTSTGNKEIKDIQAGDLVLTRGGWKPVLVSSVVGVKPVVEYTLSNGATIVSTKDHPIIDQDGSVIEICNAKTIMEDKWLSRSHLMAWFTEKLETTIEPMELIVRKATRRYTEKCGNFIKDLYQPIATYTTSMATPTIIPSKTSNASMLLSTCQNMPIAKTPGYEQRQENDTPTAYAPLQRSGMLPLRVGNGTASMQQKSQREYSLTKTLFLRTVNTVASVLRRLNTLLTSRNTAIQIVKQRPAGNALVYNLKVRGFSEYVLSAGVLVHNCDALRYILMTAPDITKAPEKDPGDKLKYGTLERALYDELKEFRNPRKTDPFGD